MNSLERAWYKNPSWSQLLLPLTALFLGVAKARRSVLQGRYQGKAWSVPLVVIGNINVGGTGKTPLIITLVQQLGEQGINAGVVSRGYGGSGGESPLSVLSTSRVEQCGDEALLIARRTGCPVVVCKDRTAAVNYLLEQHKVDIILSDDGLQHYRMHRDLELVVIDSKRGLGNGYCLPTGPLREPPARLESVDGIVVNGLAEGQTNGSTVGPFEHALPAHVPHYSMSLKACHFVNLDSGEKISAEQWSLGPRVHGVAGIGNPERFRDTLAALGLQPQLHSFPDHHLFTATDLSFDDNWPVVMTAKDAVKCESLGVANCWFLDVEAVIPSDLLALVMMPIGAHTLMTKKSYN